MLQAQAVVSFGLFTYRFVRFRSILGGIKAFCLCVIVSQKSSNEEGKKHFFGQDYNFTRSLCTKIHLWAKTFWVDPQIKSLLFAQRDIFGQRHFESILKPSQLLQNSSKVIYALDTKEQSVRDNNHILSAWKMIVRGNILHCTKRA